MNLTELKLCIIPNEQTILKLIKMDINISQNLSIYKNYSYVQPSYQGNNNINNDICIHISAVKKIRILNLSIQFKLLENNLI